MPALTTVLRTPLATALTSALVSTGVVSPYDPSSDAFFARLTTPPTDSRKMLYNTYILGLKSMGIWTKLDLIQLHAAADSQAARQNLRSGNFTSTPVNTPAFVADRGYTSDGSSSYLDTGYNTIGTGVLLQRNDNSFGVYVNTSAAAADVREMGSRNFAISGFNASSGMSFRNAATNTDQTISTISVSSVGMPVNTRTVSGTHDAYRNGVFKETLTRVSAVPTTSTILIGCFNNNGVPTQFSTAQIAMTFAGASLTATDILNLYTLTLAYLTGVGGN